MNCDEQAYDTPETGSAKEIPSGHRCKRVTAEEQPQITCLCQSWEGDASHLAPVKALHREAFWPDLCPVSLAVTVRECSQCLNGG